MIRQSGIGEAEWLKWVVLEIMSRLVWHPKFLFEVSVYECGRTLGFL